MIESVGILPWLTLKEPMRVGEVTFYPADSAGEMLGERAAILKDRLRIYRDTWDSRPVADTTVVFRARHRDRPFSFGLHVERSQRVVQFGQHDTRRRF